MTDHYLWSLLCRWVWILCLHFIPHPHASAHAFLPFSLCGRKHTRERGVIPILQKQHWCSEKLCSLSKIFSKTLIPGWKCMLFDFKSYYLFHATLEEILQAYQIPWNSSSLPAENKQPREIKWVWCFMALFFMWMKQGCESCNFRSHKLTRIW